MLPVRCACSTLASVSSFGPNSTCTRPWFMARIRSTPAMALGRCATTTTMPSRERTYNRPGERLVAFGVEIGVGLVEHDQERVAVERARKRDALALAGGQHRTLFADRGSVAFRQTDDQVMDAGGLGGGDDRLGARVGSNRAMFSATVPANSSTSCGR